VGFCHDLPVYITVYHCSRVTGKAASGITYLRTVIMNRSRPSADNAGKYSKVVKLAVKELLEEPFNYRATKVFSTLPIKPLSGGAP